MKMKFKGKLFLVTEKRRLPNGHVATLEFVDHPGVALMVPFLSRNKILLLRQYRPAIKKYIYELPAGTANKNERLVACARREMMEETGYAARKLKQIGKIYPVPGYSNEIIHIYRAEGLVPAAGVRDDEEIIEVFAFSKTQIRRLFRSGKIMDAKTIAGLAFCRWI